MLDQRSRQELIDKLKGTVKKANSKVTTEVKAEQGDFKIVITPKEINHFYRGEKVASIMTSDLDDDLREYISSDAESVSAIMMDEFVKGFSTEAFEKTAAHSTQNEQTYQRVTEKQLEAQKPALHPRGEPQSYKNITEKQFPEHDERHGSYEVTTQGQLRDETTTFKGDPLVAGKRMDESRNTITEGQLDTQEQQGSVDRGDTGAEFNGYQGHMISEKQIQELLSHQGWDEPRTITEGKDQLAKQTGELSRLSAESASKMMKEAFRALGNTVAGLGVTPEEVLTVLASLTSHENKEKALASILNSKQDVSDIRTAVKRCQYHGKVASTEAAPNRIASAILRQISNLEGDSRHKAAALFVLAKKATKEKIAEAFEQAMKTKQNDTPEIDPNDPKSIFASVLDEPALKVEGDANDGMYQYSGKTEQIQEDPSNREVFAEKAFQLSKKIVAETAKVKSDNLVPISIDVDSEKGTFDIVMKDASTVDPNILTARAERRREMAKEAQVPTGGMPPAGGGDMTQPAPPPGGADLGGAGAPPVENLTQTPDLGAPGDEAPSGEPKPPGSICPVCGSEDVDLDNGEMRCNGCGAEGSVFVELEITKWPGTMEETEAQESEGEGFELGSEEQAGLEGAGLEGPAPEGAAPPNVPVAASVRIRPTTLEKLSSRKIKLGSVCPNCGNGKCDVLEGKGICFACNTEYTVALSIKKNQPYKLAARFEWTPNLSKNAECLGCNRIKTSFVRALSDYGMSFEQFHNQTLKDKGEVILKMNRAGVLKNVMAELKNDLPLEKLAAAAIPNRWQGYEDVEKFPMQTCVERLNRRFGENASSMSGPCQGKKLAECVCSQLKNQGIYSDGLAAKVAKVHMSNDPEEQFPSEECIGKVKEAGFRLKETGFICDCLKAAYASYEDLLIETISNQIKTAQKTAQFAPARQMTAPVAKPMMAKPMKAKPMAGMGASPMAPKPLPAEEEIGVEENLEEAPTDLGGDFGEGDVGGDAELAETPDVPVSDDGLEGEPEIGEDAGLGGGVGDELGGELGGDTVDITLTLDKGTAEEIYQAIDQAINTDGELGGEMGGELGGDEFGEGSVMNDTSIETPAEEAVESPAEEAAEAPEEQAAEEEAGVEVPGTLPNADELTSGGEMAKEGDEGKSCAAPAAAPCASPMPMETAPAPAPAPAQPVCKCAPAPEKKEAPEKSEKSEEKESPKEEKSEESEDKEASMDDLLIKMKKGTITKESAGLSNLIDALVKQAEKEPEKFKYISENSKKVKAKPAQDSVDFKIQDKGKIGHEEAFDAKEPDVPRKKQLLGTEGDDMGVSDTDQPSIPAGSAAMKGEEHYRPEKQTELDGNQGNLATTASSAASEKSPKYKVASDHKLFKGLKSKYAAGAKKVKLNDGVEYDLTVSADKKAFVLTAGKCDKCGKPKVPFPASWACKCDGKGPDGKGPDGEKEDKKDKEAKTSKNTKQAQTKQVQHIETNEKDKDITPIQADKPHSLAVDEKAPSEGVSKPDVPKAPDQGRLKREETVSNELNMPEIPAGGGKNPQYDQNEKNTPEKQEDVLGIQPPTTASNTADIKKEATRIAGEMLRQGKIKTDQLADKINHLSQLPMPLLMQYEDDILKKADAPKAGLDKKASSDAVETDAFVISSPAPVGSENSFVKQIQSLMTLNSRNEECEKIRTEKGNTDLFR